MEFIDEEHKGVQFGYSFTKDTLQISSVVFHVFHVPHVFSGPAGHRTYS